MNLVLLFAITFTSAQSVFAIAAAPAATPTCAIVNTECGPKAKPMLCCGDLECITQDADTGLVSNFVSFLLISRMR